MNHMSRFEPEAGCELRFTGPAPVQKATGSQQFRPGSTVDSAVDSASAEQAFIGGIDDGSDFAVGDVSFEHMQRCVTDLQFLHSDSSLITCVQSGHINMYTLPNFRLIIHLADPSEADVWERALC
ncbi:hypothetical protein SDC9_183396 [bioreactor metagenome]|uniref:Uncharacterized protein n=1 Tax=bioreactor metagenome TaxID=1076179 RepID=A0A645HIE6_9ZZZZ